MGPSTNNLVNFLSSRKQKTVLITGATAGIGLETVKRFAQAGYTVYAGVHDRFNSNAQSLQLLVAEFPNTVKMVDLDVTDSVEKITKTIQSIDSQSPIDILINNAAVGLIGPAPLASDAQRRRIFDVNYFGLVNVTNAVIDVMLTRNQGRIINISSIAGLMPDPYLPEYSATKMALEVYTQATRQHLQRLPGCEIVMTGVHPGPVLTAFKNVAPQGNRETPHTDLRQLGKTVAEEWFAIMEKESRSVQETVDTIFKVARDPNPNLWNPTHTCVEGYYAAAFTDLSGNRFSLGLANQPSSPEDKPKAKL